MDDITYREYVVTCKTPACGNAGIAIQMTAPSENPNFVCGVCAQPITDITLITE